MSLDAAGGVEAGTGGAPAGAPSAPAGAPSPGVPSGGGAPTQGAEASGSAQPPAAPEKPPTSVDEPRFPWSEFRKLQSRDEQRQHAYDTQQRQLQEMQQAKAQWDAEKATLAQRASDYDALAAIVERDPDFAAELERRLQGHQSTPRAAAAAAQLPPEFLKKFDQYMSRQDEMYNSWQQQRQAMEQEAQAAQMAEIGRQLDTQLTGLLKERNYSEGFLPVLRSYTLDRIRQLGNVKPEEVPYLFGEWHRLQEAAFNERMQKYVQGGQAAAASLPASPGGGGPQPAITPKSDTDAFGPKNRAALEEGLKRLGWQ